MSLLARGLPRVAPFAATAVLGAAYAASIAAGLTITRFWEDEAYNLTVPLNLLAGRGYSSAGFLTTGTLDPFDVRISTGPTVLLPVAAALAGGADPVVGARVVMALFSIALAVALFVIGRRIAGPWGGALAAAVPLLLDASRSLSPLQGMTDLLGEIPSALFAVLALLVLRRAAIWPGLLLGLAVLTKTLAVLFLPAFLVAVVLAGAAGVRRRRAVAFVLGVALPPLVFELAKLAALGLPAYLVSSRQWLRFLLTGGQEGFTVAPIDKLGALVTGWHAPWWLTVPVLLVGLALLVSRVRDRLAPRLDHLSGEVPVAVAALGGLLAWCVWWVLALKDPLWLRHPAPGLLLGVPVLAAFLARAARAQLRTSPGESVPPGKVVAMAWTVAAAAVVVVGVVDSVAAALLPSTETLPEQRAVAAVAADFPGEHLRARWGPSISILVLSGKPMQPPADAGGGADAAWLVETLDRTPRGMALQNQRVAELCGEERVVLENYVICAPAED